ncbi:uncharacterized protein [Macrobrachium rosenbergii]|uniref:uncharacterized protein n=1 Tax=Macrobrachium rosenbergii TaxID=79674 RepID=UPI0034D69B4D
MKSKGPAPSGGTVPSKDYNRNYCPSCKVYGHSAQWAKCPNKSSTPTIALAVTNPKSIDPSAEGPTSVAPSQVVIHLPGGYDLLLGQDLQSPSNLRKSKGPNPYKTKSRPKSPQGPTLNPLSVPLDCPKQRQAPSASSDKPLTSPVRAPGPASVPGPRRTLNLPSRDPKLDSKSLPVPLTCPSQYHVLPIVDIQEIPELAPVPGPASVPVPEHAIDPPSRDPSPDRLSFPCLAPLPPPV